MTRNPKLKRAMAALSVQRTKAVKRIVVQVNMALLGRVPPESLGIGLYFLSRGERPAGALPQGDKAKKGFNLSEPALAALQRVMATGRFKSQRDAVETALLWVSEQGPHVQATHF